MVDLNHKHINNTRFRILFGKPENILQLKNGMRLLNDYYNFLEISNTCFFSGGYQSKWCFEE